MIAQRELWTTNFGIISFCQVPWIKAILDLLLLIMVGVTKRLCNALDVQKRIQCNHLLVNFINPFRIQNDTFQQVVNLFRAQKLVNCSKRRHCFSSNVIFHGFRDCLKKKMCLCQRVRLRNSFSFVLILCIFWSQVIPGSHVQQGRMSKIFLQFCRNKRKPVQLQVQHGLRERIFWNGEARM